MFKLLFRGTLGSQIHYDAMIDRGEVETGGESEGSEQAGRTAAIREEVDVAIIGKKNALQCSC